MNVEYIDHMGDDLSIVNAARVSFKNISTSLDERDEKLLKYLAKHKHWTPFAHTSVSLRMKAPLFVVRQLEKHQVGLVWNEVSRRYVDDEPEFFYPEKWRARADNIKQGSSQDEFIERIEYMGDYLRHYQTTDSYVRTTVSICRITYETLLKAGVCPEQARMVLPQNMYTEWVWTGSLSAFHRVCGLRLKEDTQFETRLVAEDIDMICANLFPKAWEALSES